MESTEYNLEKKSVPIIGIILSCIGLIGIILYFILSMCTTMFTTTSSIVYVVIAFLFIIGGIICAAVAKKKKYGSKKLADMAELICVIVVAVFAIGNCITLWLK